MFFAKCSGPANFEAFSMNATFWAMVMVAVLGNSMGQRLPASTVYGVAWFTTCGGSVGD